MGRSRFKDRMGKPFHRLLPALLGVSLVSILGPLTAAQAVPDNGMAAYAVFNKQFVAQEKADPAGALTAARNFLQETPQLHPSRATTLYVDMAALQMGPLKDPTGALATYDEALNKYTTYRVVLLVKKAQLLLTLGRGDEAEAVYKDWPQWVANDQATAGYLAPYYVRLLLQRGKTDQAQQAMRGYLQAHLSEVERDPSFTQLLVGALLSQSKTDEALGWARQYFMVCPYRERDINLASQLLMQVLAAKKLSPDKLQELAAAQTDFTKPNPLKEAKLPEWDETNLQKQLASATGAAKVTLLILSGDLGAAMVQAQSMILDKPESPEGMLEAARVFKAGDLNLVRANALLEFFNSGRGENPIIAFMKDHPPVTATP